VAKPLTSKRVVWFEVQQHEFGCRTPKSTTSVCRILSLSISLSLSLSLSMLHTLFTHSHVSLSVCKLHRLFTHSKLHYKEGEKSEAVGESGEEREAGKRERVGAGK
jgi:hypothetical protein